LNKPMMKSILAIHGDDQGTLAILLDLPQSAVSNRLNGKVDFRLSEINRIRRMYKLSAQQTVDIFFENDVSLKDTTEQNKQ